MEANTLILGQDQYYSLDCYKTKLNNNVLVVGTSGSGKTRSIVTPNLLQATGSYVVSDPKGNLYNKYRGYLESRGYVVKKLDFTDPENSAHYNFFRYIRSTQDIVKISHMLLHQDMENKKLDPFWDDAGQLLVQAVIAYLYEARARKDQNLHWLLELINNCNYVEGDYTASQNLLDKLILNYDKENPDSYAVNTYKKFRLASGKTLMSILITIMSRLGAYDTPELNKMTETDDINIPSIGKKKTAIFVVVSDTDRSLDGLANLFFTQTMNELCRMADKKCKDNRLPVPVRFILDDFATNCKIDNFPKMIASIRSRGISTMLMIQAEAQLKDCYGEDGKTIIGNCDTYVYLGGNDVDTAKAVAERCDVPVKRILNMPVETNWIFRRGQDPKNGRNFELDPFLVEKGLGERYIEEIDIA